MSNLSSNRVCFLIFAVWLGVILLTLPAKAQGQATKVSDSTRTIMLDSLHTVDSLRVRFIPALGSLRQEIDSSSDLHSSHLLWTDSRYFGNLFWRLPGFFIRDLGEPGKPGQFNAWGEDWRGVSVLMDGRPMNDPITGTYNLYDIPMEFIDQVEDFSGIESLAESWNAPGSALNFVTHQYNTLKPITKVRYVQGPNNDLMTDGLFTQNLLRGLNFMFGFQRRVSDGRFNGISQIFTPQGAIVDDWNVRTRIRYNFSDRFNIALTDFYNKDINGLNGGVDTSLSLNPFNDVGTYVKNPDAIETLARRDVSLVAIGRFFDDSTSITQANVYYTHLERRFTNRGTDSAPDSISDFHYAELRGIRFQQSFHTDFHTTEIGIQSEHSQYASDGFFDPAIRGNSLNRAKRDMSSGFLSSSLHPVDMVSINGSARLDSYGNESATSWGAGVKIMPIPLVGVFGDYGTSFRFPTFQESSWVDSTILRPALVGKEKNTLYRAGLGFYFGDYGQFSITGFRRNVTDAIVFHSAQTAEGSPAVLILKVPTTRTQGIVGSLNLQAGPFELASTILYSTYSEDDTAVLLVPKVIASGELSYRNKFFKDALDAKLGVRFHFMDTQRGVLFNPQLMLYSENSSGNVPAWTRMDLYAILKIGDAYITLSYENLLSANYYINPIYPMPDRIFRLGVNWVFLD